MLQALPPSPSLTPPPSNSNVLNCCQNVCKKWHSRLIPPFHIGVYKIIDLYGLESVAVPLCVHSLIPRPYLSVFQCCTLKKLEWLGPQFLYGRAEWLKSRTLIDIFYSHLRIKVTPPWVYSIKFCNVSILLASNPSRCL